MCVCTHCRLLFLCFFLIVLILILFSSGSIIFEGAIKIRRPGLVLVVVLVVVVMVVHVNLVLMAPLTCIKLVQTNPTFPFNKLKSSCTISIKNIFYFNFLFYFSKFFAYFKSLKCCKLSNTLPKPRKKGKV